MSVSFRVHDEHKSKTRICQRQLVPPVCVNPLTIAFPFSVVK